MTKTIFSCPVTFQEEFLTPKNGENFRPVFGGGVDQGQGAVPVGGVARRRGWAIRIKTVVGQGNNCYWRISNVRQQTELSEDQYEQQKTLIRSIQKFFVVRDYGE